MSKLQGKLSYKNWCILKHALRNQIAQKEQFLEENPGGILTNDTIAMLEALGMETENLKPETLELLKKELEEEKRTLATVTEIIDGFGIKSESKEEQC